MGLDERRLEREAGPAPERARLVLSGVTDGDVDAGQALVELMRGRNLAGDEAEVLAQAGRDHGGRHVERQPRRHLREDDGGEREEEVAVGLGGLPLQDVGHFREARGTLLGVAVNHGSRGSWSRRVGAGPGGPARTASGFGDGTRAGAGNRGNAGGRGRVALLP